jgi:metal-responsive CopG/Arc/MetJ family transcriptional regulator
MTAPARIQVLLPPDEAERFEDYCRERGFKKSTLIARLIREHLEQERFKPQHELFEAPSGGHKQR